MYPETAPNSHRSQSESDRELSQPVWQIRIWLRQSSAFTLCTNGANRFYIGFKGLMLWGEREGGAEGYGWVRCPNSRGDYCSMYKIGLGSRLVAKFFQLVAVVLIGAVLGGTQCVELCSFLAAERHVAATQAPEREMPCHQKHSPKESQPPADDESCSHSELVAEKRSKGSSADDLQTDSLAAVRIETRIVPLLFSSPLVLAHEHFPILSPLTLTSILRI